MNVASFLRAEQESYSGIGSIEELSDSVHPKSFPLEVSLSSEVAELPAIPPDFSVHFLWMGECEGLQRSCQLFYSPCFCFSCSQYPTFIEFYCGS